MVALAVSSLMRATVLWLKRLFSNLSKQLIEWCTS